MKHQTKTKHQTKPSHRSKLSGRRTVKASMTAAAKGASIKASNDGSQLSPIIGEHVAGMPTETVLDQWEFVNTAQVPPHKQTVSLGETHHATH
jgi:hypothetical protein